MPEEFALSATNLSYSVEVSALRIMAHHGVMEQERKVGNEFEVSATLSLPAAEAMSAISDDLLQGAVNYAEVSQIIRREMQIPSALLEHVAGRITVSLRRAFPMVDAIKVRITKLTPPIGLQMKGASVELRWQI